MITIDDVMMLKFPKFGDERGELVVIESGDNKLLSFDVKRVFYVYGSDSGIVRGNHANKNSRFLLINLKGHTKIKIIDQWGHSKTFILDNPNEGLLLPQMIWKEMYDFSHDSVLLVLSSHHYDENEYINNIESFLLAGR